MNAPPPAAERDGAFLALAIADALSLGLPGPDYITMHPHLAGSTTTSAAGFQFNARHGQDPLPAMRAWADRFGVTVEVSAGSGEQPSTWHKFEFTHAGVLFDAYAEIAAASPAIDSEAWKCAGCGAQCIAGRPADDLCHECAGRVPAAPEGLEDAAAQDEDEAGDPFMQPAPGGVCMMAGCGHGPHLHPLRPGTSERAHCAVDVCTCRRYLSPEALAKADPTGMQDPAPVVRVIGGTL